MKLPQSGAELLGDLYGGVTAAVVALPLALAFGVASGAGAIAGLYGAIAVGFFAAVFGGTSAQVSGPTGPMTVAMSVIVTEHAGHLGEAFAIVFLAGILQILFGVLRIGRFVSYTPFSVVSGFMSGIGVIIILVQTLPFFGLPTQSGGPVNSIAAWPTIPDLFNLDAFVIGAASLGVMILWPKPLRTLLPAPLAALVIGTALGLLAFPAAPVLGDVPSGFPTIRWPDITWGALPQFVQPALILALLGSIDSLLTSLVSDSITRTQHRSDRELIGQGIGNMAAGLIGGLPGAGATMRTVVNVRAGGRSSVSGALHALILLALVLGLGPVVHDIPHAALAGILIQVGWAIIDWGYLRQISRAPRDKVIVMLVTLGLTVFVDLITAVAVGLIFAGFVTARWMEQEEMKGVSAIALPGGKEQVLGGSKEVLTDEERSALQNTNGNICLIALRGHFSYASARQLVRQGAAWSASDQAILLDFTKAAHIDTSAALAIEELIKLAREEAKICILCGLSGVAEETLRGLGVFNLLEAAHVVDTRLAAIKLAAGELCEQV